MSSYYENVTTEQKTEIKTPIFNKNETGLSLPKVCGLMIELVKPFMKNRKG